MSKESKEKQNRIFLANILAKFFYYHLEQELTKKEELLNFITLEGIPFREFTQQMILDLEREFPESIEGKNYTFNLFREWHSRRLDEGVQSYENTTFKLYNQVYFSRLIDIRDGSQSARKEFDYRIERILGVGKAYGKDFTFGLFFRTENSMKECVRELLSDVHSDSIKDLWPIYYQQSEYYTEKGFHFFDTVLKNALKRSDDLLLNILPAQVAEELKQKGKAEPVYIPNASILFTDFTGFTRVAENLSPKQLIEELDYCFTKFDSVIDLYQIEKIKTIGDAYLCVGGIESRESNFALNICLAALCFLQIMKDRQKEKEESSENYWKIRIGVHIGPIVAGVIGEKKFAYDVWGDSVNTASRLESMSEPNRINVSKEIYELTKEYFEYEYRGKLSPKNKSEIDMYFLNSIKDEYKGLFKKRCW